jgi:hypothetical protein
MVRKSLFTAFVPSGISKTLPPGTSKFVGESFRHVREHIAKQDYAKAFRENFQSQSSLRTALDAVRLVNAGASTISGLLDNGSNSPTNGELRSIPFMSNSNIQSLGKNEAIYYKTFVQVGKPTSGNIRNLSTGPLVEKITKSTSSSSKDYQDHKNRSYLTISNGFNEKSFTFLLEDTYFSVQDYYDLYKIEERFADELKENKRDGVKEIYGAVLNTKNKFKIKNRTPQFSSHVAIHLIKIKDIRANVRSLLQEVIHNSEQSTENNNGKIPIDFQYSIPKLFDYKNRFGISFITDLVCTLSMSQKFQEKATIVKSWQATLPAGSIWEFNLTTHLGRGIHLNKINDFYLEAPNENIIQSISQKMEQVKGNLRKGKSAELNDLRSYIDDLLIKRANEHPSGYIFVFEVVGDRRASIQRIKDGDIFSGYSPSTLGIEFDTEITYLTNQNDEDELLVYKRTRQNKNFSEDSNFNNIFCPDRQVPFHVDSKNIGPKKPYQLIFDSVIGTENNILDDLKKTFESIGLDPKSATPQDDGFDYSNSSDNGENSNDDNSKEEL